MAFLAKITCNYQWTDQFQLLPGHLLKRTWISWDFQKQDLFENNFINNNNNIKSQIKNKKRDVSIFGITNTKIKRK